MGRNDRRTAAAFTLVELMLASLAGVIVLAGVGAVLWGAQRSWRTTWEQLALQRDAAVALQTVRAFLRPATGADIEEGGTALRVRWGDERGVRLAWQPDTETLTVERPGQAVEPLIEDRVRQVLFTQQGRVLGVTLTLDDGRSQTTLSTSVWMRNSGT